MSLPAPSVTPENAFFWSAGADGRLRFQHCDACERFVHPPSPRCPACLSDRLSVREVSGKARVATCTINHQAWHPALPPPYALAIVEIEEARYVRLTTRIVHCDVDAVSPGMPVRVVFSRQGDAWLPLFEPAGA